jgi:hypothetical protein
MVRPNVEELARLDACQEATVILGERAVPVVVEVLFRASKPASSE